MNVASGIRQLARAITAEWRKLWAIRAISVTLAALPVIALLFAWLFSTDAGAGYAALTPVGKATFDPTAISLQNHLMAQLVVGILGVLAITTEYSSGMIATTALVVPRRGILFTAKATVITGAALVAGTITAFLSFWLTQAVLSGYGAPTAHFAEPDVGRAVLGMGLYLALIALLGLGMGSLTRSSAAAIGIIGGGVLIIPALSQNLPATAAAFVARWWPSLAGSQIMTTTTTTGLFTPWAGFTILLATTAIVSAVSAVLFLRRDL